MTQQVELAVVGAGAAGLWAGALAARLGAEVLVLEKTARTGTKVLASGGTRCNLTTTLEPRAAAALFGAAGARFLATAFRALPPRAVRERFLALGVPTVEAPLEKVFPASDRARDVRDALERELRASGAALRLDAGLASLEPLGSTRGADGWRLVLAGGASLHARRVLLAPGGASYARSGTSGDGYLWLQALGLPVVEPVPALVPLTSPAAWVRELAGLALQEVVARLHAPAEEGGAELARRARPVVFTHRGISGPGAMDLSEPVAREEARARREGRAPRAHELRLDLVPALSFEALRARVLAAERAPGGALLTRALDLGLPRRLVLAALAQAGFAEEPRANALDRERRHRFLEALSGLVVPVDGTLGFDAAEVTAGGLALDALDPGTLAVRGWSGLFACGELLDLQGPIGGLNFQAAFATAELAARAAAAR